MIQKKKLTPLILSGIFVLMLGLSFAAVPLYDMFCRVTGFGGTTQISNNAPKVVLNKVVSVRFDTNVNNLPWDFKASTNVITKKAVGEKCSVCWKIFQQKCERHNCGFYAKKE